ncbi:MAG: RcnB family protein [Gammaproteobacteria bacterium]|nr:RcnB family protein [Gammaproteobacteria bacterium]
MKPFANMKPALALLIGAVLTVGPLTADNSAWADRGGRDGRADRRNDDDRYRRDRERHHFEERHRVVIREYYVEEFHHGRCPPGLRKKRNGCMPPGQAKKWERGRPLPREVIFHDVPRPLVVQIGLPPPGYRYVRVATDILLIAIGTGMVIDAIEDLGR